MKKFLSLVLALVMALSLTTVAWGELNAMPSAVGGVITLNDDVNLGSTGWTVGSGETVTLDLNGHAVSSSVSTIVVDGGTLTIKGNASGSKITTTTTSGDYEAIAVKNGGTLNFESGTVEAGTHGIYAYSSGGTLNITGGKISVSGVESVAVAVGSGSATISGCNVISEDYYAVLSWTSPCTVTSGTFTGYTSGDNLSITGGTFSVMPDAAYVAHGYLASENPNGTWTVAKTDPMIFIGTNEFYTLKEAFDAAKPNDTITITKAGTYQWWHTAATLPDNLTVKGTVDGVVVNDSPEIRAKNITIDNVDFIYAGGNGATLYTTGDSVIKNCKIEGPNGTYYSIVNGKLAIDNCEITGTATYGLHIGEGTATVTVTNSKITGWNTYGSNIDISFSNCKFFGNDNYAFLGFYNDAEITDCEFEPEMVINSQTSDEIDIVIDDCTVTDGSDITEIITESTLANSNVTVDAALVGAVAEVVGGAQYKTLAEAVAAAPAGGTVKLLADCDEDVTVAKNLTFDFNGYSFTGFITPAAGYTYMDGVVKKAVSSGTTSTGTVTSGTVTATKAKMYRLATAGTSMTELFDVTKIEKTTVTGKLVNDVPAYVPNIYKVEGKFYVEVAKADATFALKNNGAYVYLAPATGCADANAVITKFATAVVLDQYIAAAEDVECGDAVKGTKGAAIYMSGNDAYYADGSDWAYFKGEFVKYNKNAKVDFQPHKWDAKSIIVKSTDVKGTKVPVTIECEKCEKTFSIVPTAKFDNTWVKGVNYTTDNAVDKYNTAAVKYYIVLNEATYTGGTYVPSVPSTDKVQSAPTFDAGIAMYVGMSVMAAAGSAVVIGKKKD